MFEQKVPIDPDFEPEGVCPVEKVISVNFLLVISSTVSSSQ
jgi:hypothetical protein